MEVDRDRARLRPLRRTLTTYVGQAVIGVGVTIFAAVVAYRTGQHQLFYCAMLIWPLFAVLFWINSRYRVYWDDTGITQRASGAPEIKIRYDQIESLRLEMAESSEFTAQSRPFRRIAVYRQKNPSGGFIDISLRHFQMADIQELMKEIQSQRPDLTIPIKLP